MEGVKGRWGGGGLLIVTRNRMLVAMVESYTSIIYIYKLWYFTIKDSSNINYAVTKI